MAELVALGVVALVFYGLIRGLAGLVSGVVGTRYRAYRQLAAKYRGKCESRGLVDPPTVSFTHQGANVRVGLAPIVAGQPVPPRTRVIVRFTHGIPLRLELFPALRPSPPQPARGTREVRLGLNDFDRVFQVQSNDADIAREILGPETIRGSLELLRRLCPPAGMLVSINPERLLVQVDRNLGSNFSWLDSAVRQSLQLHDWLRSSVTARINEGVAVLETDLDGTNGTVFGPPVCEVCGEAIIGPHVICTQCKTPCHKDCWAYIGACSTFGCSGKNTSPATL